MVCNICHGKRFVISEDENGEMVSIPCSCLVPVMEQNAYNISIKNSRIPSEFLDRTWESYRKISEELNDEVIMNATVQKKHSIASANIPSFSFLDRIVPNPELFMSDAYNVLWLWGPDANTGHTTIACTLGLNLIKLKYKVRYMSIMDLRSYLLDFKNDDTLDSMLQGVLKYDVIIIDDAFDNSGKMCNISGEYIKSALYEFFHKFLSEGKKIICTSNVDVLTLPEYARNFTSLLVRYCKSVCIYGSLNKILYNQNQDRY